MNAIEFLIKEHNRVRDAFTEINDPAHKMETKKKLFNKLCEDLIRHETMEHKIWYPYFKNDKKVDETVKHLISEEKHAEKAIKQFDDVKSDEKWEEMYRKFENEVEHHAKEEETKLFPKIKSLFSEAELNKVGKEMLEFNRSYEKEN